MIKAIGTALLGIVGLALICVFVYSPIIVSRILGDRTNEQCLQEIRHYRVGDVLRLSPDCFTLVKKKQRQGECKLEYIGNYYTVTTSCDGVVLIIDSERRS